MWMLVSMFGHFFGPLSFIKLVGLVAVIVVAVNRHNKLQGRGGDKPFAIAAGVLLVLPYLARAANLFQLEGYFLLLLASLVFIAVYAVRVLSQKPLPPVAPEASHAPQHRPGAPIAIPAASPYMAPPPGAHVPAGPLPSRTLDEMMLYMDLSPCTCGEVNFERRSSLVMQGPVMVAHYARPCPRCGAPRDFKFVVNDPIPARPGNPVVMQYGGAAPSEILDPGQLAYASDTYAKRAPATLQGLSTEQARAAIDGLDRAAALLEEVLKFIPQGADEVPAYCFRTPVGIHERDRLPGQFKRYRIEARLGAYQKMLAQWRAGA